MAIRARGAEMITAEDFVGGVLAALTLSGVLLHTEDRLFESALAEAYSGFRAEADERGLRLDFRIKPHALHGDSLVVRDALDVAIAQRQVRRVNPTFKRYELVLDEPRAERLLATLPGDRSLYEHAADAVRHQILTSSRA